MEASFGSQLSLFLFQWSKLLQILAATKSDDFNDFRLLTYLIGNEEGWQWHK